MVSKKNAKVTRDRSTLFVELCYLEFEMWRKHEALSFAWMQSEIDVPTYRKFAIQRALDCNKLLKEFGELRARLETTLKELKWDGEPLPAFRKEWPQWWKAVRKHASEDRVGEYSGLISEHEV
ncbi:MAG: hypothetical protein KIS85_07240 [Anaerolineales bacterium]|nr:hypothetical protein [Anaerolineales bacterium]